MRIKSVDDILAFAIAREAEAHDFYAKMAEWVERPEVAEMLKGFSVDEQQHRIHLEAVKAGEISIEADEIGDLGIAESTEPSEPQVNMTYPQALMIAMQKEKAAYKMYTNLAAKAKTQDLKDMFLKLAQEEAQHKLAMEIEYDWHTA